jgi:hypothetical protein
MRNSEFFLVTLRAAFRQGLDPNGIQNINNAKMQVSKPILLLSHVKIELHQN